MIMQFVLNNIQIIFLVLLATMTLLMLLWSGIPALLWMIYRKLKSIEKILKDQQKT